MNNATPGAPIGGVQVGWYCNHEDQKFGERSHMSHHGKWRKKKGWIDTFAEPNTTKSLAFTDFHNPEKKPHCPRATPVYVFPGEGMEMPA